MASTLYPMLIQAHYDERIWGGHALAAQLGKPAPLDRPIGESWEIYDRNRVLNGVYAGQTIGDLRRLMGHDLMGHVSPNAVFPLLTKLIDAHDVLSVQVHPDDHFARLLEGEPNGKTECWYIIAAERGAHLTYGFAREMNADEYTSLVEEGTLDEALRSLPVQPGDVVYIPAGTVHAIGAGIVLFELQQTSDVTYRIYDWNRRDAAGRPRELHVDKARQVLDYHRGERGTIHPLVWPGSRRSMLIASQYFSLELLTADGLEAINTHGSPIALCALDGALVVTAGGTSVQLDPYSSLLIPAAAETYTLGRAAADGSGRCLAAFVPASAAETRRELQRAGFPEAQIDDFLAQFGPAADLGQPAT